MKRLGILCPGQGGQHPAMFDLVAECPEAQPAFQAAAAVLGEDPRRWVSSRPPEGLFQNRWAQPLICTATLAAWSVLEPRLPQPVAFAGYSLGELAAYGCAGALAPAEALRLACLRAELMNAAAQPPSGLVAVRGLAAPVVERLCREIGAEIAIVNASDHYVLGAPATHLPALERRARTLGACTVQRLPVDVASHTSFMTSAARQFEAALERARFRDPRIPVLAAGDGRLVRDRETAVRMLAAQLAATVQWARCLEGLYELGCRVLLELPPASGLARMATEAYPHVAARAVEDFRTAAGAADWVARQMR